MGSVPWDRHISVDKGMVKLKPDAIATFLGSGVDLAPILNDHTLKSETWALYLCSGAAQCALDPPDCAAVMSKRCVPEELCALYVFTISWNERNADCHLIGVRVADTLPGRQPKSELSLRNQGLGTVLLLKAHALAFAHCQERAMRDKQVLSVPRTCRLDEGHSEEAVDLRFVLRKRAAPADEATLTHHLGLGNPGQCRSDRSFLTWLSRFGYNCAPGQMPVIPDPQANITAPRLWLLAPYRDPDRRNDHVPLAKMDTWKHGLHANRPYLGVLRATQLLVATPQRLIPGGGLTCSRHGVVPFTISALKCQAVLALLLDPERRVTTKTGAYLHLTDKLALQPIQNYVGSQSKEHDPKQQQKHTFLTKNTKMASEVLQTVPAVAAVAVALLHGCGLGEAEANAVLTSVFCIHFFLVESSGIAAYGWHTDCKDLAGMSADTDKDDAAALGIRSLVVQLGAGDITGMCMFAHEPVVYQGQGAAVGFTGSAIHCSVPWKAEEGDNQDQHRLLRRPVWKMSIFWLPRDLGM